MSASIAMTCNKTAEAILSSFANATHERKPYDHWLLEDVLPEEDCDAIAALPFGPPGAPVFDGRRDANNSARVYFSREIQARFPICRTVAAAFDDPSVRSAVERMTGARLANGRLRIEYCQDVDGFWLEPHVDIPVKLFTMLVYLADSPDLYDAGTDIYDDTPEHNLVGTAPCAWNTGFIFIPGKNTWHGFTPRPIHGVRKSLIINYVSPEWRAVEELA